MGESVHAGGSGEAGGHGGHHVGVDDGDLGDVVGVNADELADLVRVGDYVVDGDLSGGAGRGRDGDGERGVLLGGSDALEAGHVGKLGVLDDDADALAGVHGGAAADGNHHVSAGGLVGLDAILDVLDGGVGLDLRVEGPGDAGGVELVGDLGGHAKLDEVGVGADEGLLVAAAGNLARDLLDGTLAVIADGVEYEAVDCHANSFRCWFEPNWASVAECTKQATA